MIDQSDAFVPSVPGRRRFIGAAAGLGAALGASRRAHASLPPAPEAPKTPGVVPFTSAVPESALADLRRRLDATRWPERETVDDWSQGAPLARMKALVEHWRTGYDWRRCEASLNGFGQYRTEIDGLGIHFLHTRSRHEGALPLLITHGWPGSVIEFHKIIRPLTDPTSYGGTAADAFHVIAPSLPGYGFSDRPTGTGWGLAKVAQAWAELMERLGYERYVAQGGDWGAGVTTALGKLRPRGLAGIHLNMPLVMPAELPAVLGKDEQAAVAALTEFVDSGFGYAKVQATRPQTLGYALADSPVGQAAWIYEKFALWTDSGGDPETVLTRDEMLDDITLYWLTGTAASSARFYWENSKATFGAVDLDLPVGCSIFPREIYRAPRSFAERCYRDLVYWNELDRGGHFAAFEQPQLFVSELRACFRKMRAGGRT